MKGGSPGERLSVLFAVSRHYEHPGVDSLDWTDPYDVRKPRIRKKYATLTASVQTFFYMFTCGSLVR